MKMKLKAALLLGAVFATSTGALAQQQELPAFLKAYEGVSFEGTVSGMDLYSMDGFEGLWMVSPDGATVIAGTVFSNEGRDIGAVFTGGTPITSFEVSGAPEIEAEEDQAGISPLSEGPVLDQQVSPILTDEELTAMENGVSLMEQDIFGSPEDGSDVSQEATGDVAAQEVTNDAQDALAGFSDEDKAFLMAALVQMLANVESEEEFKSVVEVWTNEVVERHRKGEDISGLTETAEPVAEVVDVSPIEPAADESEVTADTAGEMVLEEPEMTLADQLLEEVRYESLWFGVGNHEAPVVYAFIDPTCPYCARAIVNIGDAVSEGELQLRVALAPVVSRSSPDVIAAIFQSEMPPIAFMEHEYEWTQGRSPLSPAKWGELPGEVREGLLHNVDIMKKYEIPGVPFFIFDTEDGARIINGLPESAEAFATAIQDPFMGTN
jgi:hypothetical protein